MSLSPLSNEMMLLIVQNLCQTYVSTYLWATYCNGETD